jgi:hypothetical protein
MSCPELSSLQSSNQVQAGCVFGINLSWYAVILSMLAVVITAPPYNFSAIGFGLTRCGTMTGSILAYVRIQVLPPGKMFFRYCANAWYSRLALAGPLSDASTKFLARRNNGIREAEQRLLLFMAGMWIMPVALLIFGLCAYYVRRSFSLWCTAR